MKKILFTDIDGTLINSNHQVTPLTKLAIQNWIAQGNLFVPVSARNPAGIATVARKITTSYAFGAFNGGLIYDHKGQLLQSITMPFTLVQQLLATVTSKCGSTVSWNLYAFNRWYCLQPKTAAIKQEEAIVASSAVPISLAKLAHEPLNRVHKILLIGPPARLIRLKKMLSTLLPSLDYVNSAPHLLEIIPQGVSKSAVVPLLSAHYHVSSANTWAFGDNYNDETLLATVTHSYLMGNAPSDLKAKFKHITRDHNHDGIYCALAKHYA